MFLCCAVININFATNTIMEDDTGGGAATPDVSCASTSLGGLRNSMLYRVVSVSCNNTSMKMVLLWHVPPKRMFHKHN